MKYYRNIRSVICVTPHRCSCITSNDFPWNTEGNVFYLPSRASTSRRRDVLAVRTSEYEFLNHTPSTSKQRRIPCLRWSDGSGRNSIIICWWLSIHSLKWLEWWKPTNFHIGWHIGFHSQPLIWGNEGTGEAMYNSWRSQSAAQLPRMQHGELPHAEH